LPRSLFELGLAAGEWLFPLPLYWQGFYLYAFQIYADFSGYTDIARGLAALLGSRCRRILSDPISPARLASFGIATFH
jgi:D-alanyl-lipoteichoic acid acyltransferase DltB (MBOAT superfamily)